MLLLTYDPNVKPTPDYTVSLVSPYGSMAQYQKMRDDIYRAFIMGWMELLRPLEKKND